MHAFLELSLIFACLVQIHSLSHSCKITNDIIICREIILEPGEHLKLEGAYQQATSINCFFCRISSISSEFFNGLRNLKKVSFGHSGILAIDANAFQGMSEIKYLYLSGNSLRKIKQDLFTSLTNLETLKIAYNDITEIKTNTFNRLGNLKTLDLCSNDIREIEPNGFDGLGSLRHLNLTFNKLIQLKGGTFKSLTELVTLKLDHNRLFKFEENSFQGLSNLQYLYLNDNNLKTNAVNSFLSITGRSLTSLKNLLCLDLEGNHLTFIDENSFEGLSNLKDLSLNYNFIQTLSMNAFANLDGLENLDIELNLLFHISEGTFANLKNLRTLKLSYNGISTLPEDFSKLIKLESLTLNDNKINSLDILTILSHIPNLANVTLNNNTWGCDYLKNVITTFDNHHVEILDNYTKYTANVKGIGCKGIGIKWNLSDENQEIGRTNTYVTVDEIGKHLDKFEKSYKSHSLKLTVMTAALTVSFLVIVVLLSGIVWFYIYRKRRINIARYIDVNLVSE